MWKFPSKKLSNSGVISASLFCFFKSTKCNYFRVEWLFTSASAWHIQGRWCLQRRWWTLVQPEMSCKKHRWNSHYASGGLQKRWIWYLQYLWWAWSKQCTSWQRAHQSNQRSTASHHGKWSAVRPVTCCSGCMWSIHDATAHSCKWHHHLWLSCCIWHSV